MVAGGLAWLGVAWRGVAWLRLGGWAPQAKLFFKHNGDFIKENKRTSFLFEGEAYHMYIDTVYASQRGLIPPLCSEASAAKSELPRMCPLDTSTQGTNEL